MKVDPQMVRAVADLAKLKVADAEIEEYIESMSNILDLVEQMQAVATDGIEPMANPLDAMARLRPDAVTEKIDVASYQAIAPETANGLYLVPRVVD